MTNKKFNFNDAVKELQAGKSLNGKDGVLTSLVKQLTEAALQAEIEQHLDKDQQPNRKNGASSKP
jgi:transposase-like protein